MFHSTGPEQTSFHKFRAPLNSHVRRGRDFNAAALVEVASGSYEVASRSVGDVAVEVLPVCKVGVAMVGVSGQVLPNRGLLEAARQLLPKRWMAVWEGRVTESSLDGGLGAC